jgi:hypothetical protein
MLEPSISSVQTFSQDVRGGGEGSIWGDFRTLRPWEISLHVGLISPGYFNSIRSAVRGPIPTFFMSRLSPQGFLSH